MVENITNGLSLHKMYNNLTGFFWIRYAVESSLQETSLLTLLLAYRAGLRQLIDITMSQYHIVGLNQGVGVLGSTV